MQSEDFSKEKVLEAATTAEIFFKSSEDGLLNISFRGGVVLAATIICSLW
jgi:hypothetical protein